MAGIGFCETNGNNHYYADETTAFYGALALEQDTNTIKSRFCDTSPVCVCNKPTDAVEYVTYHGPECQGESGETSVELTYYECVSHFLREFGAGSTWRAEGKPSSFKTYYQCADFRNNAATGCDDTQSAIDASSAFVVLLSALRITKSHHLVSYFQKGLCAVQITGGTDALVSFVPKDRRVDDNGELVFDSRPWYGTPFGSLSRGVNPYDDTVNEGLYSSMTCGRDDAGSHVHCVCRLGRSPSPPPSPPPPPPPPLERATDPKPVGAGEYPECVDWCSRCQAWQYDTCVDTCPNPDLPGATTAAAAALAAAAAAAPGQLHVRGAHAVLIPLDGNANYQDCPVYMQQLDIAQCQEFANRGGVWDSGGRYEGAVSWRFEVLQYRAPYPQGCSVDVGQQWVRWNAQTRERLSSLYACSDDFGFTTRAECREYEDSSGHVCDWDCSTGRCAREEDVASTLCTEAPAPLLLPDQRLRPADLLCQHGLRRVDGPRARRLLLRLPRLRGSRPQQGLQGRLHHRHVRGRSPSGVGHKLPLRRAARLPAARHHVRARAAAAVAARISAAAAAVRHELQRARRAALPDDAGRVSPNRGAHGQGPAVRDLRSDVQRPRRGELPHGAL